MYLCVVVLGVGFWGIMVVLMISWNVLMVFWVCRDEIVEDINWNYVNSQYLGNLKIYCFFIVISYLFDVVSQVDVVVMGVLFKVMWVIFEDICDYICFWVFVILFVKGFEIGICYWMIEIIKEILLGYFLGVLIGFNLVKEVLVGYVVVSVFVMEDEVIVCQLQLVFNFNFFWVYINMDMVGCEFGGVFKNVIVIVVGMGDGVGVGENIRFVVIMCGLVEIICLGIVMGGWV